MLRIIVTLHASDVTRVDPSTRTGKPLRFEARLDGADAILALSDQPLADAARALIERGYDPQTKVIMRHAGKAHDSFIPLPLSHWASLSYTESDRYPLKAQRWRPRAVDTEGKKQASDSGAGGKPQ